MKNIMKFGLILGLSSFLSAPLFAKKEEAIVGVKIERIKFNVMSGGCTKKEHFDILLTGTNPIKVALHRHTPDRCKMVEHSISLEYTLEELGIPENASFSIEGKTFHIDVKRHGRGQASMIPNSGTCIGEGIKVDYSLANEFAQGTFVVTKDDKTYAFNKVAINRDGDSIELSGSQSFSMHSYMKMKLKLSNTNSDEEFNAVLEDKVWYTAIGATIDNDPNMRSPNISKLRCKTMELIEDL